MSIRMNKRFVLSAAFLLSTVVVAQLIVAVAAQPRTLGVSPGDWVSYSMTVYGNATLPTGMENVTWAKITVQEISGMNITCETIAHYPNGTEETETMFVDVNTGGGGPGFFIAANLNAGDLIYNSTDPYSMFNGMTINETIVRTYAIGNVEVNHWNLTISYSAPGMNQTSSFNWYWYKSTGVLTEAHMYNLIEQNGNITWVEVEIMMLDIIPEFPPALIPLLFMIATLTAVWLRKTIWSTKKSINKPYL